MSTAKYKKSTVLLKMHIYMVTLKRRQWKNVDKNKYADQCLWYTAHNYQKNLPFLGFIVYEKISIFGIAVIYMNNSSCKIFHTVN